MTDNKRAGVKFMRRGYGIYEVYPIFVNADVKMLFPGLLWQGRGRLPCSDHHNDQGRGSGHRCRLARTQVRHFVFPAITSVRAISIKPLFDLLSTAKAEQDAQDAADGKTVRSWSVPALASPDVQEALVHADPAAGDKKPMSDLDEVQLSSCLTLTSCPA